MKLRNIYQTKLTIVIGSCLKRKERVDIDSPQLYALLGSVVGVNIVPHCLGWVNGVVTIARSRLRQTKGDANVGLKLASGSGSSNEAADVTKDPLKYK